MKRPNVLKGNGRIGHYKSITYEPSDGQKEIWLRQQPPLVVDVLESCFDVIHDFYVLLIISAHEILTYGHSFTNKLQQKHHGPTDG